MLRLSLLLSGSPLSGLSLTLVLSALYIKGGGAHQGVLLLDLDLALVELLLHRVLVAAARPLPVLLALHLALLTLALTEEGRRVIVLSGSLVRPATWVMTVTNEAC